MKTITKALISIMGMGTAAQAIPGVGAAVSTAASHFWSAHPFVTAVAAFVMFLGALLHVPTVGA